MEVTDDNVAALARYLAMTLDPDSGRRKYAERFLEGVESNPNYGELVLRLAAAPDADPTVRTAAAVAFKNYVRRNWPDEDAIAEGERSRIRDALVDLMLRSPPPVQKQLSDAISIVGKCDFPDRWPGLIARLVDNFSTGDFHLINGALQTAHSLFKRYRYEFKSERLWTEIAFVLAAFAAPLTALFADTLELCRAHAANPDALRVLYSSLYLVCKLFYSLNSQDLPEFFEDNMPTWMPKLLSLVQTRVPQLDPADDDHPEPSPADRVREAAVECAGLYALKYSEEFAPYAPGFVTAAWNALVDVGPRPRYDALASGALAFLANVAEKKQYAYLFEDPATLGQICEKVVIPNMELRDSDLELFEDDPEEYIRRDMEGSDVETRRRAACDLVKVLSVNYEARIFHIFGQYVQAMLARSAGSPDGGQWRCKDVALFLVTSMSERGRTARAGVTAASDFVDLSGFFRDHVLPDLVSENVDRTPVLKADAIKYVITFRSLLPKERIASLLPHLMRYLNAESFVVVSYAACCLERVTPLVGAAPETVRIAPDLLRSLLLLMEKPAHGENDYVMRCVMRVLLVMQHACLPVMGNALTQFAKVLTTVSKNPSRPNFNHYLFECISISIKIVCKASPAAIESFEDVFFPIFQEILQQEVQEFMPYVFQLLSLMVEQRCIFGNGLPENSPYLALVSCLLTPPLWDKPANVRALVRLLSSLTYAAHHQLIKDNRLNGMLGVFQKLIASKTNDLEGFALIRCMLQNIPEEVMRPYLKQIVSLMFQRLSSSKTAKFVRGLVVFLGYFCVRYGPVDMVETLDSAQPLLFSMYCERILIPEIPKLSGRREVRTAAAGYGRLLCECPALYEPGARYGDLWAPLTQAVVTLLEAPEAEAATAEEPLADDFSYEPAYCQLSSARAEPPDDLGGVSEPRKLLSRSLRSLSAAKPGLLGPLLQRLSPEHRAAIEAYLNESE